MHSGPPCFHECMKNIRWIITERVPEWALRFPLGTEVSVTSSEVPVWGKVTGYGDGLERIVCWVNGKEVWEKMTGRFILVRYCDDTEDLHPLEGVALWAEQKIMQSLIGRIKCMCGRHAWDEVPRRGLLRTTLDYGLFSAAVQFGEQRCLRESCTASRDVVRRGWIREGSKPKWKQASKTESESIRALAPF